MDLKGKVIAITRPEERCEEAIKLIEEAGGIPLIAPTLQIQTPKTKTLKRLCENLKKFDWIIFTSPAAIKSIKKHCEKIKLKPDCKIAVIGPKTQEALEKIGLKADVIPSNYTAEGLLETLSSYDMKNKNVAIPRTLAARNVLPEGLKKMGAKVYIAEAYKSANPKDDRIKRLIEKILKEEIDAITFTSPLTVENLLTTEKDKKDDIIKKLSNGKIIVAAIGPITAAKLKEYGIKAITPENYTIKDMLIKLFHELSED
ncbi:MAG: uroporphyrinogen-III synthase [Methanobacteriaceae archaeon]|nr:uroporphyrinogen-III synthase [Methanobacteriaceae archaeon]